MGEILNQLMDEQLEGKITNAELALRRAKEICPK
jgi:hypothetical protein